MSETVLQAEVGRRAAFRDVRWRNSTAYIAKAKQARQRDALLQGGTES